MKIVEYPLQKDWDQWLKRPIMDLSEVEGKVRPIMDAVQADGDDALRRFTAQFDRVELGDLAVTRYEIEQAIKQVPEHLQSAIKQARSNIEKFHVMQRELVKKVETMPGVLCWRKSIPIEKVGLYVPGGTAPLFSSVLMLAVPAKLAGCAEIILCTPPDEKGRVHPAILYAADLIGVSKIIKVGGAQAVAAMTFGTETVPKVWKIFGPGNQYVTAAKQLAFREGIGIDMPAGPSEVAIIADASAKPSFVAADLLSQAEHGIDSQVLLVTTDPQLAQAVGAEVDRQIALLPRKDIAKKALENSRILLVKKLDEAAALINRYAPEHLIIAMDQPDAVADRITNAGSVFLGHYTPESAGDYASGTNHTLPTNGFARVYSGVSLDSFFKKITFQSISKEGLQQIGPVVETLAEAEQLMAHKNAVSIRLAEK